MGRGSAGRGGLSASILIASCVLLAACTRRREPAPGVLLVVLDTLRADHVGTYGYGPPTTPEIDRLAARAVVFENAYAPSSWTKPSIASLLTGEPPARHRVLLESPRDRLGEDLETLAEVLRARGFRTAGFSENPHVSAATGFAQGFEVFEGEDEWEAGQRSTVRRAIHWLEELGPGDPFLLYLHLLDPHDPYEPGEEARSALLGAARSEREEVRAGRVLDLLDTERGDAPPEDIEQGDVDYLVGLYDGEVRGVDAAVGELLERLEGTGRDAGTIVIVTSDHGEEFLEHGRFRHGYHLYEETLRVPLVVHAPGVEPRRVDTPVQLQDLAPTVLELLGHADLPGARGRSLVELLEGGVPQGARPVFAETSMRGIWRRSVRAGRWKLVRDELAGTVELYDLDSDPGERIDLSGEREHFEDLAALEVLLGEAVRPRTPPDYPVDPEVIRALERLGYAAR